jgi:hypothetical protein
LKQILSLIFLLLPGLAAGQQAAPDSVRHRADSATIHQLDNFFSQQDSLDIFELIDSLIRTQDIKDESRMAIRLGYNSNIIADNRTFNINQFGLASGMSYYHKSGLYADATQYWSQEYKPNFYLTTASGGYMKNINKWYTLLAEYSHYFYHQPSDSTVSVPYTNNVGMSNYFEVGKFVFRLDYYFYFGDKQAHRIMPSAGMNFIKRKWAGFDRISFYPNATVLFGSEQTTSYALYPNPILRLIYNRNHTPKLPLYYPVNKTEFGVMNYSFSIPITMSRKDWTFLLNYTYSIPKSLPGEDLSLQSSGYLSFSITRYIGF